MMNLYAAEQHLLLMLLVDRTSNLAATFREGIAEEGDRVINADSVRVAVKFVQHEQQNLQDIVHSWVEVLHEGKGLGK